MDYVDRMILLAGCIFEIYILYDFFRDKFEKRDYLKKSSLKKWFIHSMAFGALYFINCMESAYINLFVVPVLLWIYTVLLFQGQKGARFFYFLIAFSILWGCEFLFVILLQIPTHFVKDSSYTQLSNVPLQMIAMKILTFIVFMIAKRIAGKSRGQAGGKLFWIYLCVPLSSLGILIGMYYSGVDFEGKGMLGVWMTLCFGLMLLGNILIFYVYNRYVQEMYARME